ncbi:hypothetical protein YDYSG_67530 [Paenibacillus tyrfis]|uniref:hypothetical protein n=1 Tax=Paenibacillus tyrfis TaxID=1501230 RepID=UPI002490A588|nr:hypothetical protein [Paenibacillus tyrfis]GLI10717.1 hypothetical protein YDYSG_67530 [Paenibacillus tyrfis]
MKSDFQEVKLSELSDIQVDYFIGPSKTVEYRDIMIIKYSGEYGFGSAGNSDAVYMKAMGRAALEAWKPDAIILDWSDLKYEWGDMLEMVLDIDIGCCEPALPMAVIVGPPCEEAVRTLLLGIDSEEELETIEWVFKNKDEAIDYIEKQLQKAGS